MKKLSAREKQLEYWKSIHSKSKSKAVEQSIPTTPLKDSTNTPKSTAKYVTQKKQTTTMATTPVQEAQEEKATQKQSSTPSMVFSDFEELKEFLADKLQRLSHFQEEIGKGQLVDIYCADAADLLKEVFEGVCVKCDVIEEKMQAFQAMTQRNEELELALTLTMRENELLHSAVVNLSEFEKE